MTASLKIGRLFGIDIGVHWSWTFIFLIVTWSFAAVLNDAFPEWDTGPRWAAAVFIAGIFFVSILIHELSHAIVSNRNGLPVRSITLFVFGGVSNLTREPDNAGLEFKIAIVGPLASLILGVLFAIGWLAIRPFNDRIAGVSAYLAAINGSLAIFNMLPGFPLDGGRVFRSIVWWRNHNRLKATHTAARVGEWIAYGIMGIGIIEVFFSNLIGGIWLLIIGFFLRNAASSSYEQLLIETTLRDIPVRDVMQTVVHRVAPDMSIDDLVHENVLRYNARAFPVMTDGQLRGLVTLSDVRDVPRDEWPTTSVFQAMTPAERLHVVPPSENLAQTLRIMGSNDINQLPVVRGHELVGMLTRGDLMRYIQTHRDLQDGSDVVDRVGPHERDDQPRDGVAPGRRDWDQ